MSALLLVNNTLPSDIETHLRMSEDRLGLISGVQYNKMIRDLSLVYINIS